MNQSLRFLLLAALIWDTLPAPTLAQTQDFDVALERVGPFCPTNLLEGDRDFAGTPKIYIRTDIRISSDGLRLLLSSRFYAREEGGDHTTVDQTFTQTLWTAPDGQRIVQYAVLTGPNNANLRWSEPRRRGYQEYCNDDCAKDMMRQPEFIQQHRVIGDTEGEDISYGGRCDDASTSFRWPLVACWLAAPQPTRLKRRPPLVADTTTPIVKHPALDTTVPIARHPTLERRKKSKPVHF